jgi:hypothetical protein
MSCIRSRRYALVAGAAVALACGGTAREAFAIKQFFEEFKAVYVKPESTDPAEKMLVEALDVVRSRRETYGPPREHFARTVQMLNGLLADKLKEPLTEADWAQIMIIDKLARHRGPAKSADTPIDLAGYASCLAECEA